MPELISLLWGPFSWEIVNTHTTLLTNCLIQKRKKFYQKIGCQWIIPCQIYGLVCVWGEGIQVEKIYYQYIWGECLPLHTTSITGLLITSIIWCVSCCPLHLSLLWNFFKLNIWELFRIRIHLHQHWLNQLSHFSLSPKHWQFKNSLRWGGP